MPSCGCTLARLEIERPDGSRETCEPGDPLPPGTEVDLVVELDTRDKRSHVSSDIRISCNDPRGLVVLGLSARVEPYFDLSSTVLELGELGAQDRVERSLTISGRGPEPFRLTLEPIPRPDGLSVTLVPKEPDPAGRARTWEARVVLGPGAREGNVGYPVTLHSDQVVAGARPDAAGALATYGARVIVRARVLGVIDVEPRLLAFGLVRPGQVARCTLMLRSLDPAHLLPVDLEPRIVGGADEPFPLADSIAIGVERAADGRSAVVTLTLERLPDGFEGSFVGRLVLAVDHPEKREVAVAFSGLSRR